MPLPDKIIAVMARKKPAKEKPDVSSDVEAFLAKGGEIEKVEPEARTLGTRVPFIINKNYMPRRKG